MKTWASIVTLLCLFCYAGAQTMSIEKTESGDKVSFSFLKEVNVAYYIIEAANDTTRFDIIGRLNLQDYNNHSNYQFTNYEDTFAWYEVKQIDMSGSCTGHVLIAGNKANYLSPPEPGLTATRNDSAIR